MPITATDSGGGDFELIPEATHQARCYRLIDLGTQQTTYKGEPKQNRKILICWEIPSIEIEIDGEMKPGIIMSRYTLSVGKKSSLGPMLESWRGRSFTDEERAGFNVETIVGAPCLLSVVHSEDGKWANIAGCMALPQGDKGPVPVNPKVIFSLETPDWGVFDGLSDKIQAIIAASPEYQAHKTPAGTVTVAPAMGEEPPVFDDPIPF